jgi:uncharacterized RDD family membrane protein YckC
LKDEQLKKIANEKVHLKNTEECLAPLWKRCVGFVIDFGFIFIIRQLELIFKWASSSTDFWERVLVVVSLVFIFVWAISNTLLLWNRAQSVGKYLMNTQIVLLHTSEKGVVYYLTLFVFRPAFTFFIPRFIPPDGFYAGVWFLLVLVFLTDSLFVFRKNRRTLHDLVVDTVVINFGDEEAYKKGLNRIE